MKRDDWLPLVALALAVLVGYLYAHRDKCILCRGTLGFIPREGKNLGR